MRRRVIADFGANIGQNIDYFVRKSDLVIAVEANPELCKEMAITFEKYIQANQLVVCNYVLSDEASFSGKAEFYVHKSRSILSSVIAPEPHVLHNFTRIFVDRQTPGEILSKYIQIDDRFLYAKFDLEGFDSKALNKMISERFIPEYLSIEAHEIDSLIAVLNIPEVTACQLLPQIQVSRKYSKSVIVEKSGSLLDWNFIDHSSGPFGEDLKGFWLDKKNFLEYFLIEEGGWKDIHATTKDFQEITQLRLIYILIFGFKKYLRLVYRRLFTFETRRKILRFRKKLGFQ